MDAGAKWCRPQDKGSMAGMRISDTMLQPFQFSPLEITGEPSLTKTIDDGLPIVDTICLDADDALHAPANADLGTIRVRVDRIELLSLVLAPKDHQALTFQSVGPVHERSKKLGVHCVTCAWLPFLVGVVQC